MSNGEKKKYGVIGSIADWRSGGQTHRLCGPEQREPLSGSLSKKHNILLLYLMIFRSDNLLVVLFFL